MPAPNPHVMPYNADTIRHAAALIAAGEIVAVPTETVYGLAADATNATAVTRVYAAKGRPSFNPLIVHLPDREAVDRIAILDEDAAVLASAFWPGPLTLVLPLRPETGIAAPVTAGQATVAVRVPEHRAMRALLAATGKPLAAPSANRSNAISPTRAEHVAVGLGAAVPLIIDDGACAVGVESTIVAGRCVLRPGAITAAMVAEQFGDYAGADATLRPLPGRISAPGQLPTHYAPSKPLRLEAVDASADEYLIGFGAVAGNATLSQRGDLSEAAARLFDALHRADASDRAGIAVAPIPDEGIGAAINDRLRRAANR